MIICMCVCLELFDFELKDERSDWWRPDDITTSDKQQTTKYRINKSVTTGLPSPVCVVCCAIVMAVSVNNTSFTKIKI